MIHDTHRNLLFTVSNNQAALLRAAIPPAVPNSTSNGSANSTNSLLDHLYQQISLIPDDIQHTDFKPQRAAAAVVDGDGLLLNQLTGPHSSVVGQQGCQVLQQLRAASETLFLIYWHAAATEDAEMRWEAFRAGANMVTHCPHAVAKALQAVAAQQQHLQQQQQAGREGEFVEQHQQQQPQPGSIRCDWCGLPGLTAAEYWRHQPLYHIDHDNRAGVCQVCGK